MKAELISIGDEILIGQIINTNSVWMAQALNAIGISVVQITTISDYPEDLVKALDDAQQRADIIIMTGGLGPTKDDRTKKVLCQYFNSKLATDKAVLEHVTRFFEIRNMEVSQINKDQALVPECCQVLFNDLGTAPGMWFEKDGKIFVSMPGVPFEMEYIMTNRVLPRLIKFSGHDAIVHKTVQTFGIGESTLAQMIEKWEDALPDFIHLAYLPSPGQVRLRLSAYGTSEEDLQKEVDLQVKKLLKIIPDAVYGYGDQTMAGAVGELLVSRGKILSVAESCTGGNIAHSITSIPGASNWFVGGIVSYTNEMKMKFLNVSNNSLEQYGAVSEQVVKEMAEGIKKLTGSDYAISTSGIAGPDGGSEEKPVGTVWVAIAGPDYVETYLLKLNGNRDRIITRASQSALDSLRLRLIEDAKLECIQ